MEITLRDRSYTAEHLTDLNYLPLGNLFVDDKGGFTIEGVEDFESLPSHQKVKLVQPLMVKLCDPDQKAAIAHSLCSIFPSLPRELIRYSGKSDFAMNLTLTELLQVSIAVANELNKGNNPVVDSDVIELARLEQEFEAKKAQITAKKGFGK
jgi:hypothetical protein